MSEAGVPITDNDLRAFAALVGDDMHAVRKVVAIVGRDVHDLRKIIDGTSGGSADTGSQNVTSTTPLWTFLYSPFSSGISPPTFSAPEAGLYAARPLFQNVDSVYLLVASSGWPDLCAKLLSAVSVYPGFAEVLPMVEARLNGAVPTALVGYKPEIYYLSPGITTAPVDWGGRYGDVLCVLAVLVYPAGQAPQGLRG